MAPHSASPEAATEHPTSRVITQVELQSLIRGPAAANPTSGLQRTLLALIDSSRRRGSPALTEVGATARERRSAWLVEVPD